MKGATLSLITGLGFLLASVAYVAMPSGPLAPVLVTAATVENRALHSALFGIGTVEARYTYKIGPTVTGRLKWVGVQVGDYVHSGQLLGEMETIDHDEKVLAQEALLQRAEAAISAAEAQVRERLARFTFSDTQAQRYKKLLLARSASQEEASIKRHEFHIAEAALAAARANLEVARHEARKAHADLESLVRQRDKLRLIASVDGLVTARHVEPGSTVIAGQSVVEIIDPKSLWISVRFDQVHSSGLNSGLPAQIVLRSQAGHTTAGKVLRVEPLADAVTQETLGKVSFDTLPERLPIVGELAEVTVTLPPLPLAPVVPNASVQRVKGRLGVWVIGDGALRFTEIRRGVTDLDGRVQVLEGLKGGEQVVVHSQRALHARSRVKEVERLPGELP